MNGYAGKILKLNLADRAASVIETAACQKWVGGHGIGSAVFWDLCQDKTIDGFDERNVMTIMTSPLTGTLVPGGASRVEVQAIGVQAHPYGWFTRSNLSHLDYMERGRRIWNLDNAIWTMQGRHRDMAKFAPFVYDQPQPAPVSVQAVENGKWKYVSARGWTIDREKFEEWKTRYYKLEGWDPDTG